MDDRLVEHYNVELRHLREMAGEFAREFPKIAGRLSLDKDGKEICPDPYVERLLEGFAWLAARVHLKLDSEFPRFTQSLLETVYPHYLCPVPSMAIVRFQPVATDPALAPGFPIPRGSALRSHLGKGERTPCVFKTAHAVRLLPLKIAEVRYFTRDLAELNLPAGVKARAAIRIRIEATVSVPWKEIAASPLSFHIRGTDDFPALILEHLLARKTGVVVQSPSERGRTLAVLPDRVIHRQGLTNDESLLPPSPRTFEGYRLLREYFAFPQRFLFFEIRDFDEALGRCKGNQIDLVILLGEIEQRLEGRLDATSLELFCTPVINLFSKTLDRINVSDRFPEFHAVPDRNRPMDFEIFEIESVTGYGTTTDDTTEFRPFYQARDTDDSSGAFFTAYRMPRVLTEKERKLGRRSSYGGAETYVSIVDAQCAPYHPDLRQLGVQALCTNRHLPIQMSLGIGPSDFSLELSAPVESIRCLSGPTVPRPSMAQGMNAWRLISHLTLNYYSLMNSGAQGATALRDMLKLYIDLNDRQAVRQVEGLLRVKTDPLLRRVATPGPITFARGLQITLEFDETSYEGTGVFLLGGVLEQFFAKYVSLNSFVETVIRSQQRGELIRWPSQMGKRQVI